jgi:hypothetical protein
LFCPFCGFDACRKQTILDIWRDTFKGRTQHFAPLSKSGGYDPRQNLCVGGKAWLGQGFQMNNCA